MSNLGGDNPIDSSIVTYGRTKTYIQTFFGSFILLIFFIAGLFILKKSYDDRNNIKSTTAKILSINPIDRTYTANISYSINNKEYTNNVNIATYIAPNSIITIYYNINNPNIISTTSNATMMIVGSIFVAIAVLCGILMFYNTYFVSKSDMAARNAAFNDINRQRYGYYYNW